MNSFFEILVMVISITIQSIFGVGLLLFGTPSLLLFGYDFANTINILMPISITISSLQFFKSKVKDKNFLIEYNLFCLPFLIIFLVIALKFKYLFDFKLLVAILLIFSSALILNKRRFSSFKVTFFKLKKIVLIGIGCVHGLTNMGGSFLAIYSTLISKNVKEIARYYICYGYLIMGVIQYFLVLFLSFKYLTFEKLYYVLLAIVIYFPTQRIFKRINDNKFLKYINVIALIYGLIIILSYLN
tara:strand:- start:782 stop:1510 length:729 start_codon:yes stop_codon:yes gene_type:complete